MPSLNPSKPSLTAGITAAVVGALLGAIGWAVLTSVTNYKIGYAAVGVGALAGFLAGKAGGGAPQLPPIAAGIGLLGCIVGDILTDAHQVAAEAEKFGSSVSMFKVLKEMIKNPSDVGWPIYKAGFDAIDVLFYAFAAVAAYRLCVQHGLISRQSAAPQQTWSPPTGAPVTPPPAPETPAP